MLAERETYESDDEEQAATNNTKQEISIGKINIDYEAIIAKKTAQEKENLSSGMKVCSRCWKFCYQIQDKMADFRKLRQMSKKYAEEDFKEREQIARTLQARAVSCKLERSQPKIHSFAQMTTYYWYVISKLQPSKDSSIVQEIGRIDATKRNLDSEFAAREKEMAEKLALEKVEQLRAEIRLMNEAKRQLMAQEMAKIEDEERAESEVREIGKLDSKFTNFDKHADEAVAAEAIKIRDARKRQLEQEMLAFEEEKEKFEDDFEEMKTEVIKRQVGKLDNTKTKFDSLEQEREQQRLQEGQILRVHTQYCPKNGAVMIQFL